MGWEGFGCGGRVGQKFLFKCLVCLFFVAFVFFLLLSFFLVAACQFWTD